MCTAFAQINTKYAAAADGLITLNVDNGTEAARSVRLNGSYALAPSHDFISGAPNRLENTRNGGGRARANGVQLAIWMDERHLPVKVLWSDEKHAAWES